MITSYNDMRLHHLLEIQALKDLDASDAVKELMIISILSGIAPEDLRKMPAQEYDALRQQAAFLQEEPPTEVGLHDRVEINGTVYLVCHNMENVSTGQYIDWLTYSQGERNLADLYSVMCIPEGHKYGDGYSMDKVKEDMADLPLPVTYFISAFWITSLNIFLRRSAREMRKEVRKLRRMKLTKAEREKVVELAQMTARLQSQLASGGIVLPQSTSSSD